MPIKLNNLKYKPNAVAVTLLFVSLIALLASGCSHAVDHTVSKHFRALTPHTVAVLPIKWRNEADKKHKDVANLFRVMSDKKLRTLDYQTMAIKSIDSSYAKTGNSALDTMAPKEIAEQLGTDAVLIIEITGWESNTVVNYAYLKVEARFSLYSKDGERLWSAEYDTTDSDIRMDKESMELAVIKVYEPRVQRFINYVFSTLPAGNASTKRKTYFDWLQ